MKPKFLFPILLISLFLSGVVGFAADCDPEEFADIGSIRFVREAEIPAGAYTHLSYRDHLALQAVFGSEYRGFLNSLPSGSRILDSGGGYSLYGVEYAGRGHRVLSVNAQNFYSENLFALADPDFIKKNIPEFMSPNQGREARLGNLNGAVLHWLAAELEVIPPRYYSLNPAIFGPKPNAVEVPESLVREDFAQFIDNLREAMGELPKFRRETGLVQDVLPAVENGSQDLIVDMWGAVSYSGDRLQIIEQFARKLSPRGRAFIFVGAIKDQVILPGGKRLGLFDYLVSYFPKTFRYANEKEDSIMILGDGPNIDLTNLFEARVVPKDDIAENVPYVEYRLRSNSGNPTGNQAGE